jgi:hypothetical protein
MSKMTAAASVDMVLAETSMRVALLRQDLELHNRTVLGSATKVRKRVRHFDENSAPPPHAEVRGKVVWISASVLEEIWSKPQV